jgi:superfamily II DNA or RNA helicase
LENQQRSAPLDLIVHETEHEASDDSQHIQERFRALVEDPKRTATISDDVVEAAKRGRNCLVLTRWTEHLDAIAESLLQRGVKPLVLHGKLGKKARVAVIEELASPPAQGGIVLVATASLLGEGFDCPPLDTLFLAFPIKFKGSVVQCVGRILRPTATKALVEVHDYVDVRVPVVARMHDERRGAYATLGFDLPRRPRQRAR